MSFTTQFGIDNKMKLSKSLSRKLNKKLYESITTHQTRQLPWLKWIDFFSFKNELQE